MVHKRPRLLKGMFKNGGSSNIKWFPNYHMDHGIVDLWATTKCLWTFRVMSGKQEVAPQNVNRYIQMDTKVDIAKHKCKNLCI